MSVTPAAARPEAPARRPRVFTGTRPTGPWHIAHMWAVLTNMVRLQEDYDCFYCIVDYHALTTAYKHPERIQQNIREIAIDWMAGGVDPMRSTLFVQSHVPEVAEFTLLLSMFTPVPWLERNPTYTETLKENAAAEANTGLFTYPVLQTADICLYKGELVPIGKDQAIHLHLSQDIAKTFQFVFKRSVFPVPDYLFAEFPLIPGLDNRKMSKSYGNSIEMRESAESTRAKVARMYTDPLKQRKGDPGRPDECPVFLYHKIVSTPVVVEETRAGCSSGALGCVDCKSRLADNLVEHLAPMRERRKALEGDPRRVDELLAYGAEKARKIARETIREVREVMGLNGGFYLSDGGDEVPPALQFNAQDPEYQGGYYQYFIEVLKDDIHSVRARLLELAPQLDFKFRGFTPTLRGELVLLATSRPKLEIPGFITKPFGAGYEILVALTDAQAKAVVMDQLNQLIIQLSAKIYGVSMLGYHLGEFKLRLFGKSLSPSDEAFLARKLEEFFKVEPGSVSVVRNDLVNTGIRSIEPPKRSPPPAPPQQAGGGESEGEDDLE
ncbi:MAG: tryptophan--tRNA ligase [bacterium]